MLLPAIATAGDPGVIQLSPGYGRPDAFVLRGRLIEDKGRKTPQRAAGRLRNLWETYKALESDEIEGAVVEISVGPHRFTAQTDEDGVFQINPQGLEPPLPAGPQLVDVKVTADRGHPTSPRRGRVHVLPAGSVAIISDFDDTIIQSGVTDKVRLVQKAALRNAAQLPLVPGAAPAYRAAVEGPYSTVFYLSGSPQNFLPRLLDVIRINRLPAGPVLLKNFGTDPTLDQTTYKLGHLRRVLETCRGTRFLLVGDSGEHDPELYARLRGQYPDRIIGVIIRQAPGGDHRPVRFTGMTLVPDYRAAPTLFVDALPRPDTP